MGVVPRDSTVKLILKGTGIYNVFDFERGITAQKKRTFPNTRQGSQENTLHETI